jgi:hypothetical protein
MAPSYRHSIWIILLVLLTSVSAHAQFDLSSAKTTDMVAASKYFTVSNNQIMTYDLSNLSLLASASTSGVFHVESTQKATAVQTGSSLMPEQFSLSQNFPNPFNMSTKILYSIPVQSQVSLVVYDITGRVITTLVSGQMNPGHYTANFNIDNIASGTYYYRMIASGQSGGVSVETKRMIVMK